MLGLLTRSAAGAAPGQELPRFSPARTRSRRAAPRILAAASLCTALVALAAAWSLRAGDGAALAPALAGPALRVERAVDLAAGPLLTAPASIESAAPSDAVPEGPRAAQGSKPPAPTSLDAILERFLVEQPDPRALQEELRQVAASASLASATLHETKDGTLAAEVLLPRLEGRAKLIARGASRRVEIPVLGHLGQVLDEPRLVLALVEIDGRAEGVFATLSSRARAGEAFDSYLRERARSGLVTGWQVSFGRDALKALQTGAAERDPETAAPRNMRGSGRQVQAQVASGGDPTAFQRWLELLPAAGR